MNNTLYDRIAAAEAEGQEGAASILWDHYAVLGISNNANAQEIKKAYRKLALRFHPDKAQAGGEQRAEAIFRAVAEAYTVLSDPEKRMRYDAGEGVSFEDSIGTPYEIFARTFFEARQQTDSDTRSGDWTLHKLSNYQVLRPGEEPEHMRAIVNVGLGYLAKVLDLETQAVVLLRHARIDILWIILAFDGNLELSQERFQVDGYPITYYDNPLQPGIKPTWSDQNVLGVSRPRNPELLAAKELSLEDYIERQERAREEAAAIEASERRALRGG
eukprot:TRINITY_DN16336_c0_g1_i1.p1 TRINITY_DN16336_c0_g1~~TRINITY_DN16336_c0_g1_i1.p1  ORF type:complete len:273 (-),score=47.04 TRINITY_DN16336_c0_g1_i1:113-931(-)